MQEVRAIQSLVYYMAIQYWNLCEKDKILEDLLEKQRTDLENAINTKGDLM